MIVFWYWLMKLSEFLHYNGGNGLGLWFHFLFSFTDLLDVTQIFPLVWDICRRVVYELCISSWLVKTFHGTHPGVIILPFKHFIRKSSQQEQKSCSAHLRWRPSTGLVTLVGGPHQQRQIKQSTTIWRLQAKSYQQYKDWTGLRAQLWGLQPLWSGEWWRSAGDPIHFSGPLSSWAVIKPQGRQLYQHNLRLHVAKFNRTPLSGHQSQQSAWSKYGEKQQKLNNSRTRGAAFWGCGWSS